MRNLSIVESENFVCQNCGNRGELTKHGRCEACDSEQVFPAHREHITEPRERRTA